LKIDLEGLIIFLDLEDVDVEKFTRNGFMVVKGDEMPVGQKLETLL
jgi:hypothetical protein